MIQLIFIGIAGIVFLLFFLGLIGPQWLKTKMRKFNRWAERDTIFKVNPYQPISNSAKKDEKKD